MTIFISFYNLFIFIHNNTLNNFNIIFRYKDDASV